MAQLRRVDARKEPFLQQGANDKDGCKQQRWCKQRTIFAARCTHLGAHPPVQMCTATYVSYVTHVFGLGERSSKQAQKIGACLAFFIASFD
eukprot:scaffold313010_cov19-Tisochrysis_lutea.AAC.1